jgi:hypothetical protein
MLGTQIGEVDTLGQVPTTIGALTLLNISSLQGMQHSTNSVEVACAQQKLLRAA